MKKPYFDVLVIGPPCVDIVFGGLPHWPRLDIDMYCADLSVGVGNTFNTAATLSRLGLRVGLMCELGNDFFSRYILEQIDSAGISREFITLREQSLFSVSVSLPYEGERGFVSYTNVTRALAAPNSSANATQSDTLSSLRTIFERYDFGALFMYTHPDLLLFLEIMRASCARIFFDVGCGPRDIYAIIKHGDFFMPNCVEALKITGAATPEEAVRILARHVPTAVVTVGPQGVIAYQHEQLTRCAAYPLDKEVVDTTGAGDAFDGGFIYGILKGYSLLDALRCGTICGSLSTTALTGTAAVPTASELERLRSGVNEEQALR